MGSKIKIGIVGTGRMGVLHLSKFRQMPEVELVGIYEPFAQRALEIESKYKVQSFSSLQDLCFSSDGLIIASPTPTHFSVAKMAMEMGCHVLIEKPFCETLEEGQHLQALAKSQKLVCQVGFLERFRLEAMMGNTPIPQSAHLECHRLSISVGREASVDVVSDLMIHDVDLVLSITKELPHSIRAEGFSVVTDYLDIAKARLEFPSGRIAHLTASRIAPKLVRSLQVVSNGSFYEFDFITNTKTSQVKQSNSKHVTEPMTFDALEAQSKNFVMSIQKIELPKVTAGEGSKALYVVNEIRRSILDINNRLIHPIPLELEDVLREN